MRRFDPFFPSLRWRTALASATLLALCLSGPVARAQEQDAGQDEVMLKSGGSIRGTVVVSEPGKSVEIAVMGELQPRVVPWSEVEQVQKGKYAPVSSPVVVPPPAPPSAPAAPPPPAGPKLGDPGVVRLHIDSPVPVTLVHKHDVTYPVTESWVDRYGNTVSRDAMATVTRVDPLCSSPCDRLIGESDLRIVGKGFPSSPAFDFRETTGDVTIHVRPGNSWAFGSGIAAMVLGSVATLAGALVIPLNQADSTTTDLNTGAKVHIPDPALRAAGIGLIAGGLAAIGGGIALFLTGRTMVSLDPHAGAATIVKPRYWLGEF